MINSQPIRKRSYDTSLQKSNLLRIKKLKKPEQMQKRNKINKMCTQEHKIEKGINHALIRNLIAHLRVK